MFGSLPPNCLWKPVSQLPAGMAQESWSCSVSGNDQDNTETAEGPELLRAGAVCDLGQYEDVLSRKLFRDDICGQNRRESHQGKALAMSPMRGQRLWLCTSDLQVRTSSARMGAEH